MGSVLAMQLAPRHYFYDRCNEILAEAEFDETVEMLCQPYENGGRLSIPPGRYFRMLFVGQFALFTYLRPFLEQVTHVGVVMLSVMLLIVGASGFVGTVVIGRVIVKRLFLTLWVLPAAMAAVVTRARRDKNKSTPVWGRQRPDIGSLPDRANDKRVGDGDPDAALACANS